VSGLSPTVANGLQRLAAGLLLVTAAPLMLLLAGAVRLTSRGPAVYRQVRIGQFGQSFTIFKFRTMRVGSDAMLAEVLAAHGQEIQPFFKVREDPRITRLGHLLRRTSLDELPQLWNVVRGDMNLIGPRPQSPAEVREYDARSWRRLLVKPGLTGLWQVSGRSQLSTEDALELDLAYVRDWSPALDAKVLLKTPRAVVAQRGAY